MKKGPGIINVEESFQLLEDLLKNKRSDLFFETIKQLSFSEISAISLAWYRRKNNQALAILRSNRVFWTHYLAEFRKMDASVPLNPPAELSEAKKNSWHYHTVMQASNAIYRRQNQEIAYLKRKHPHHQQWADIDAQDINAEEATLELLIARHQELEALNESIIRTRINPESRELILQNLGITRLPEALFNDSSLADYWRNLEIFDCDENQLYQLPNSLGTLGALQALYCYQNQIQQLPDTLGNLESLLVLDCSYNQLQQLPAALCNLAALREIYCDWNQLRQLPDNLGNLVALQGLYCNHNQLRQLPATLGNLMALQKLDCRLNQLQQLPAALVDLTALEVLFCSENQLRILPDNLRHQFGEEWYQVTLANQAPTIAQPGMLPLYATATAQRQNADHQETADTAVAINNLAKLKLN